MTTQTLDTSNPSVSARRCNGCGLFKELRSFHAAADRPMGVRSTCAACERLRRNARPAPASEGPSLDECRVEYARRCARLQAIADRVRKHLGLPPCLVVPTRPGEAPGFIEADTQPPKGAHGEHDTIQ